MKTHIRHESVSSTTSSTGEGTSVYFEYYSRDLLIDAVRMVLKRSLAARMFGEQSGPDLKPYRLLITLFDKPEIGPIVLDEVILDVFRALHHAYSEFKTKGKEKDELIKSANLLFGTFDSGYIWDYCGDQFEKASKVFISIGF